MGKRKSAAKPQGPKKREGLATTFQCLFCNHENAVTVKIDRKTSTGELNCKVCGQSYQTSTNYLSAPIDVYSDWIDACDAVAKEAAGNGPRRSGGAARPRAAARDEEDEEEDGKLEGDFVVDDEGDGEGEYGDE